MLVQGFLTRTAERLPDKVALVCGGQRLTYADLAEMSDRFANALRHLGVGRGDRVAVYHHNSVETVVGLFGALKAGCVFVLINPATKPARLRRMLNDHGASVLLLDGRTDVRELARL